MLEYKNTIGITNDLWTIINVSLDAIIKKCWQVLPIIFTVKLLYDFLINSATDTISIRDSVRTIMRTILIIFFLAFYKDFLMLIDSMVGIFSDLDVGYKKALDIIEKSNLDKLNDMSTARKILEYPFLLLGKITNGFNHIFSMLTHQGSIIFMDSLKSLLLILLTHFGPISAIISLLPGNFNTSFNTWLRNYINISCWTITLSILQNIVNLINKTNAVENNPLIAPLSIALIFIIFSTPIWTSMFLGNPLSSGLTSIISSAGTLFPGIIGKSINIGRKITKR